LSALPESEQEPMVVEVVLEGHCGLSDAAFLWIVPKKTKDLMALIPDISERTARDWLNELKTAESLIINIIRESADFYISQRVSFSE
jgi:hypothetical protein